MKHYLLPETGTFYKANLHSHSTCSDGILTPQEMKEMYMAHGYSVIAFSDHELFIPHPELTDENFVALHAFEAGIMEGDPRIGPFPEYYQARCCHIGCIALDPTIEQHPFWHRTKHLPLYGEENVGKVKFDESKPDYEPEYSPEGINEILRLAQEAGFFTILNHPYWNLENREQYIHRGRADAVEIYNHGTHTGGHMGYAPKIYDEFLREGNRMLCVAADDNHNPVPPEHPQNDALGGFIMLKADKLDYLSIADALKKGNFYASRGPIIHELWYDTEEKAVHIRCDKAAKICCSTDSRKIYWAYPEEGKDDVEEAVFPIPEWHKYFRITVYDKNELTADTNAYFTDTLPK